METFQFVSGLSACREARLSGRPLCLRGGLRAGFSGDGSTPQPQKTENHPIKFFGQIGKAYDLVR